jgi:hypothetical protein
MEEQKQNKNFEEFQQLSNALEFMNCVTVPEMERQIQEACNIIYKLLDLVVCDTDEQIIEWAQQFYRQHAVLPAATQSDIDDLPF